MFQLPKYREQRAWPPLRLRHSLIGGERKRLALVPLWSNRWRGQEACRVCFYFETGLVSRQGSITVASDLKCFIVLTQSQPGRVPPSMLRRSVTAWTGEGRGRGTCKQAWMESPPPTTTSSTGRHIGKHNTQVARNCKYPTTIPANNDNKNVPKIFQLFCLVFFVLILIHLSDLFFSPLHSFHFIKLKLLKDFHLNKCLLHCDRITK